MPLLLLVSFVTAAYGAWPFDVVILLPAVIQVAVRIARKPNRPCLIAGGMAWAAINLPALALNLANIGSFWFIWMAPLMLISYVALMYKLDRT